jgi:hypothetical protein
MQSTLKPRNAFAIPARARQNAGAMTHRNPPRRHACDIGYCPCGAPMDPDDNSTLCIDCEEKLALEGSDDNAKN